MACGAYRDVLIVSSSVRRQQPHCACLNNKINIKLHVSTGIHAILGVPSGPALVESVNRKWYAEGIRYADIIWNELTQTRASWLMPIAHLLLANVPARQAH